MSESDTLGDSKRRNFLIKVTSVVGGAGAAAACIPFVASMNPSADVLAKATTEVDLSGVPVGGVHTVAWQGKPVFIFHRTPEEIKDMEASDGGFDPVICLISDLRPSDILISTLTLLWSSSSTLASILTPYLPWLK